jgi:hypothetical protein
MMTIPAPGTSAAFIIRLTVASISAAVIVPPSNRFTTVAPSFARLRAATDGELSAAPMKALATNTAPNTVTASANENLPIVNSSRSLDWLPNLTFNLPI